MTLLEPWGSSVARFTRSSRPAAASCRHLVVGRAPVRCTHQLEGQRGRKLQRVALERRSVREFLEILEAHAHVPHGQDHVCRNAERVDSVVRRCLCGRDGWPRLVCSLPLIITDYPKLELQLLVQREKLRQRIIEVEGLTRMNSGSLLTAVEFVHLEGRERRLLCRGQENLSARRDGRSPVTGADIVARAGVESPGGRQESEDSPN